MPPCEPGFSFGLRPTTLTQVPVPGVQAVISELPTSEKSGRGRDAVVQTPLIAGPRRP